MRTAQEALILVSEPSSSLTAFIKCVEAELEDVAKLRRAYHAATGVFTIAVSDISPTNHDLNEFRNHMQKYGWYVESVEYIQREHEYQVRLRPQA